MSVKRNSSLDVYVLVGTAVERGLPLMVRVDAVMVGGSSILLRSKSLLQLAL